MFDTEAVRDRLRLVRRDMMKCPMRIPANPEVVQSSGPYPQFLDLVNTVTALQNRIFKKGLVAQEPEATAAALAIMQAAPPHAEMFDVGAHVGIYSALTEAIYSSAVTLTAFEPMPSTAEICRSVRDANDLTYEVFELALSTESGYADLQINGSSESGNSLTPNLFNASGSQRVETMSLDSFCAQQNKIPYFLKIDVESHEAHVLQGGRETIRAARPWIVCELLPTSHQKIPDPSAEEHLHETLTELGGLGYKFYLLEADDGWASHSAEEVMKTRRELPRGDKRRNWLLAPESLHTGFTSRYQDWYKAIRACNYRTAPIRTGGFDEMQGAFYDRESALAHMEFEQPLTVELPAEGSITGRVPKFQGWGTPGGVVHLLDRNSHVAASTSINISGYWSTRLAGAIQPGPQELTAVMIVDGKVKTEHKIVFTVA
ncbi:FkbM family methyltransferase [Streptomyces sp. MS2.AVA.5]|uniref:FkbM family methyltransferase n=1 Tax=Streptomyces achmelvichensis TaxID=3134111 RepID=A0ACC6Q843_9ACTN